MEDITFRYTLDGTEPTASSPIYTAPIVLALGAEYKLKAKAFKTGWETSDTASADYVITGQVAQPTANIAPGTYPSEINVAFSSATAGHTIRYTTDGTDVNEFSPIMTASVAVVKTTTFKVRAYKNGWTPSQQNAFVYTMTVPAVANPTFSPDGGTFAVTQDLVISCATAGANIHYTLDGTEVTEFSPLVNASIQVDRSMTVKAKAFLAHYPESAQVAKAFVITGTVADPTANPTAGVYLVAQHVALSCSTSGSSIHYTLDGTDPTEFSPLYTTSLSIEADTVIKAKAYVGSLGSQIVSLVYTITGKLPTPVFNPTGGTYQTAQSVVISF